jgi:Domain of unknown function (DUF4349)
MRPTDMQVDPQFDDLLAELRALPIAAPATLRARVRALGEPEMRPTLQDRLAAIRLRRALLLAAPACVAALLSIAVVHGLVSSGDPPGKVAAVTQAAEVSPRRPRPSTLESSLGPAKGGTSVRGVASGRPVDYDASLRIRVRDEHALSHGTADAMRVARSFGGYVSSLEQTATAGHPGEADLVLRVPVAHVEDSMIRLSKLGTVVDQHVSVVDLQQRLDQQRRRIRSLRIYIVRLTQTLRNRSLAADVLLRLRLQLEDARRGLGRTTRANRGTLREAALSEIAVSLTTQDTSGAATTHRDGQLVRAARKAISFLSAAGAVALFLVIAFSPLALLGVVWINGTRAYRRREERRLLATAPE